MDNLLRDHVEEKQARLERMMAEYDRRRLVEHGIKLRNRTELVLRRGIAGGPARSTLTMN